MFLSVFDLFKIGIGPSSSHTMGPMVAASRFLEEILIGDWPRPAGARVSQIKVSLHGSLAYTGIGHASDRAIILGLCGLRPDTIDLDQAEVILRQTAETRVIKPDGHPEYRFDPAIDLVLDKKTPLPGHANGMAFVALDDAGRQLLRIAYFSVGGGFVVSADELLAKNSSSAKRTGPKVPFPFKTAAEMLKMAKASGLSIADMKRQNEETIVSRQALNDGIDRIWATMDECISKGLSREGIMPGGLKVKRRARAIHDQLNASWGTNVPNPLLANDWLSVYAMAVNEENASGGKIVTAPTNGAAGVLPAVVKYYLRFHEPNDHEDIRNFMLTAAAIGGLLKTNASISGAEVGCQGEVGSAAAMAAAGLAAALGGTPEQIENAAEIALEHHLGMTCDPIGGLVQVPCIERNALGAVKAVTAASLALKGDGSHFVPLDAAIETMRQTGRDMDMRYKETSLGGLAVNVVEC